MPAIVSSISASAGERTGTSAENRIFAAQIERIDDADGIRKFGEQRRRGGFRACRFARARNRHDGLAARNCGARDDVLRVLQGRGRCRRSRRIEHPCHVLAQARHHDRACVDRHDIVRSLPVESQDRRLLAATMPHDERHLVAIAARRGHSDGLPYDDVAKTADALQRGRHDVALPRKLRGIREVLHLAAAAFAEHGAKRLRARRRLAQQFDLLGDCVGRLQGDDPNAGTLRRKRAEAKDDHAAGAPNGLAVRHQVRKFDVELRPKFQHPVRPSTVRGACPERA